MSSVHTAHATFYLDVTYLSYNQAGNYSTYNIHIHATADSGWGSGTVTDPTAWSCYGGSGTSTGSGTSWDIANYNVNVGHDANGYLNWTFTASVGNTGTSTYGTGVSWSQSGSAPRIPKVPGAPGISAAAPVGRSIAVTVTAPADNGGSGITSYTTQYSLNGGAWTGNHTGGTYTYTGLAPGSYVFRAYCNNAIGQSPVSASTPAKTVFAGGKRAVDAATFAALSIMRRYSGTAWVEIATNKRAQDATTWVDFAP